MVIDRNVTVLLSKKNVNQPDPGTYAAIMVGLNPDNLEDARHKLLIGGARDKGVLLKGDGDGFVHAHNPDGNAPHLWKL